MTGSVQGDARVDRLRQARHAGWVVAFETGQMKSGILDMRNGIPVEVTAEREP